MAIGGVVVLLKFDSELSEKDSIIAKNDLKHNIDDKQDVAPELEQVSNNHRIEVVEEKLKPTQKDTEVTISANALLANGDFEEVIAIYSSSDGAQKSEYESALVQYLTVLAVQNPSLAKNQIVSFLQLDTNSPVIEALIEIYASSGEYDVLIEVLRDLRENYGEGLEDSLVLAKIHENAKKQINLLSKKEDYQSMLGFLDKMIDYDDIGGLYSLELAQSYLNLGRLNDALDIMESLEYDPNYYMKARKIKSDIRDALETGKYKYALDLKKIGDHYFVDVELDGRIFQLLLDTGASYIMIDSDKATDFDVLVESVTMQTAGDPVEAKMCQAAVLRVGDIELEKVKFIASPFNRDNMDGLLGMNFFKKFDFHIDQDDNKLYLNPK